MAEEKQVDWSAVGRARQAGRKRVEKTCPECATVFLGMEKRVTYCSPRCKMRARRKAQKQAQEQPQKPTGSVATEAKPASEKR